MADFWNAFGSGQQARVNFQNRKVRDAERAARVAQVGAVRQQYGDASGGNVDDALALQQNNRVQTEFDAERQQQAGIAALSAYRGMVRQAEGDGLRVDPEQQAALRGAAFDRIASVLPSLGVDASQVPALRAALIERPEMADQLIQGLRSQSAASTYAPRAVIDPNTGRAVFVRPGEEVGMESADASAAQARIAQSDQRIDQARDSFEHRVETDDPDYQRRRAAARSEGTAAGEVAAGLPRLDAVTDTAIGRIDALVNNPNLDAIFGLPNLSRLDTGGFGAAGVVPGTPAADALAQLNTTIGDVSTAAYESLRGGGQITEAERTAIERGLANLERSQSPQQAVIHLQQLSQVLDQRRRAAHTAAQAGVTGRSNAQTPAPRSTPRAAPQSRNQPAPSNSAAARRQGESTDDYLSRMGL